MAKFLLDDGSTISSDRIMREYTHNRPTVSPILMTEIRMIDTLKEISKNLNDSTLDKTCIMQLIEGKQCECTMKERNCDKCITKWYMSNE